MMLYGTNEAIAFRKSVRAYDVIIAFENMVLAATSLGLGTC